MARPSLDSEAQQIQTIIDDMVAQKDSTWTPYLEKCDRFYSGFRHNRLWPGTKISRSSVKLHTVSDVIETLYSMLSFRLFYSGGEDFFDTVGSDLESNRQVQERLRFLIHTPIDASGRTSFWGLKRGLRYIIRYGLGGGEIFYRNDLGRATIVPVSPYDLYWQQNGSTWIDDSRYIAKLGRIKAKDLARYRNIPNYHIPSDKELNQLEQHMRTAASMSDHSKSLETEGMTGGHDVSGLLTGNLQGEINIWRVTTVDNIRWLINSIDGTPRLIFKAPNNYGIQPYTLGAFRPLIHAIGGISMAHLLSGNHEVMQLVVNSLLDYIELTLIPPRGKSPGNNKKNPWGPGLELEFADQKRDEPIQVQSPNDAWSVYGEAMAQQRRTAGLNEMAISGNPQPSNANRTLGGIARQEAASEERNFGPLTEIEDMFVVPSLTKCVRIDSRGANLPEEANVPGVDQSKSVTEVPLSTLTSGGPFFIQVRGATRMVGVARLSGLVGHLMQILLHPQVMQEAAKAGKKLNFAELDRFVMEGTGISQKFTFWEDLSQEDMARRQQMDQGAAMIQAQSRQQSDQLRSKTQLAVEEQRQASAREERMLQLLQELMAEIKSGQPGGESGGNENAS